MQLLTEITGYLSAGKATLDLLKGVKEFVPKGHQHDAVQEQIQKAERSLRATEAYAAQAFGFNLCQ
jgi:hypothetical protein